MRQGERKALHVLSRAASQVKSAELQLNYPLDFWTQRYQLTRNFGPQSDVSYTVTQLSWHPRAFFIENFLSYEECDHLIEEVRLDRVGYNRGMRED